MQTNRKPDETPLEVFGKALTAGQHALEVIFNRPDTVEAQAALRGLQAARAALEKAIGR